MAKAPQPGRVKTRLQPVFSAAECAEIQRVLVRRTARWAAAVAREGAAYVAHDPPQGWEDLRALVPPGVVPIAQRGQNLGERLERAVGEVFERLGGGGSAPGDRAQPGGGSAPGGGSQSGGGPGPPARGSDPATGPLLVVGVDTRLTPQ